MRSILLHIQEDDCLEARLQAALDLARQSNGHVTCLQVVPHEMVIAGEFYGTITTPMAAEHQQNAKALQDRMERRLSAEDVNWEWIRTDGMAATHLAHHAAIHDLVIMGAKNPAGKADSPSTLVSELVAQVRAPILVTPATMTSFSLTSPVAVAWNGSAEGAHALRAATPLLSRASSIHIFSVREEKDADRFDLPSTDAAKYLSRYGIEAEIIELTAEAGTSIAQTLLGAAEMHKASYLVMGAYGRSRFLEWILGGVTREILMDPAIPLLLSH